MPKEKRCVCSVCGVFIDEKDTHRINSALPYCADCYEVMKKLYTLFMSYKKEASKYFSSLGV